MIEIVSELQIIDEFYINFFNVTWSVTSPNLLNKNTSNYDKTVRDNKLTIT